MASGKRDHSPPVEIDVEAQKIIDRAELRKEAERVAEAMEKAKLTLSKQMMGMVKLAAAAMRKQLTTGSDERATYSTAAKVMDYVCPPKERAGVVINLGNFTSHLGLPPSPVDREGTRLDLPPTIVLESIAANKPEARPLRKIVPPPAGEIGFAKKPLMLADLPAPPEPQREESFQGNPEPKTQEGEIKEQEKIPRAEMYGESR